jgi:hypothetical protein
MAVLLKENPDWSSMGSHSRKELLMSRWLNRVEEQQCRNLAKQRRHLLI